MTTPGEFPGFTSPDEVIAFCRDRGIQMVDLKFTDVPGTLQHVTIPLGELKPDVFVEGTGFDGSSIRGFQQIQESDMLLVPDATTGTIDPFFTVPHAQPDLQGQGSGVGRRLLQRPALHRPEG